MAKGPSKLIVSIGGELAASFKKTIKQTQMSVSGLGKNISREMNNAASASAKGFKNVLRNDAFQAAAVGAAGIGTGIMSSVRAAVEFESAMADVKKVVDFETPQAFKAMQKDIINLSREIPLTAQGFAEIVAAAGQAGIAQEELQRFAKSASQMAVAFDISAAEAGDAMAKFRTAMGLNQDEVENLADSINHLSNNFASSAPEITNYMMRVGALKGQMAISEQSIAAFGSTMIASGSAPEVAATSFRNLTKALMKGDTATKAQMRAFEDLRLSATDVASAMQKDAQSTILQVFERLAQAPAELRASLSTQLFGSEARALVPLLTQTDKLKEALDSVAKTDLFKGSMLKEFEARSATAANQQQLFSNNMQALGITIGTTVLPALNSFFEFLTPVIKGITDFAEANPFATKTIVLLGGAFVGLVALAPFVASFISVIGSLKLALAGIAASKAFAGIMLNIKTLMVVGKVAIGVLAGGLKSLFALILANPIGLLVAAIVGIGVGLVVAYNKVEWFRDGVNAVVGAIAGFFQGLWDGIVAGFTAVVDAVKPILDSWVQVFQGIFQTIQGIFQVFWGILTGDTETAVEGVGNIFGGLQGVFSGIVNGIGATWNLLTGIVGGVAQGIVNTFMGLPEKLANVGTSIIDTIKNGFVSRFEALKGVVVESFQKLRDLLPFSDAKKGPFRDLTASGRSIMTTIAKGVTDRSGTLKDAMASTAETAMNALAPAPALALATAGGPTMQQGSMLPPAPRQRGGDFLQGDVNMGALRQQTLAPTINITAQTDASAEEIGAVVMSTMQQLMDDSEAAQRAGLND